MNKYKVDTEFAIGIGDMIAEKYRSRQDQLTPKEWVDTLNVLVTHLSNLFIYGAKKNQWDAEEAKFHWEQIKQALDKTATISNEQFEVYSLLHAKENNGD